MADKLQRPLEFAERWLVDLILQGDIGIGDRLPPERELAEQIGVTRPTLREALRHLETEGWLIVQHGKPTVVRDFWRDGNLGLLSRVIQHEGSVKPAFITNLLEFRLLIAPTYTRDAIAYNRDKIIHCLSAMPARESESISFAKFDWCLHRDLTAASGNVIYPLLLNGFSDFYQAMAMIYFRRAEARSASTDFYAGLLDFARIGDSEGAYQLTEVVMRASIDHWREVSEQVEAFQIEAR